MDPNLLAAITEILLEAIKILGPASIAAFVAYKAGKSQLEIRLKEVALGNEMEARNALFQYYREKLSRLHEQHGKLTHALGEAIGFTAESEDDATEIRVYNQLVYEMAETLPADIRMTKREMEKFGLTDNEYFEELDKDIARLSTLIDEHNAQALELNVFTVLAVHDRLYTCNGLLLEKQGERLFEPYIRSASSEH